MAAFTGSPTGSTQYNQDTGVTQGGVTYLENLHLRRFTYTHAAGAGTGEINLVRIPAGRVDIHSIFSRRESTQFAASADLHLGYRSYTEPDGDVIAADDNAFGDNEDAGGGALTAAAWTLPTGLGVTEINSRTGLTIYAMVDSGNIEDTDTINGWVVWADYTA